MSAGLCELDRSVVRSRLIRWGEWKMRSGVSLGFGSMSSFMKLGGRTDQHYDPFGEVDSECMLTNKSVEMLPHVPALVVRVEYVSGYRDSAVKAHSCGISKRAYYNYLDTAHDLVAKHINYLLRDVHKDDIKLINLHQCV